MQYRLVRPPSSFQEQLSDALDRSGSNAKIIRANRIERSVVLDGDYSDILLAHHELARINVKIVS